MKASLSRSIAASVCVALFCAATTASAQVADSLSALQSSLEPGDRLTITDRAGVVTDGKLLSLSRDSLHLSVAPDGVLDVPESSLARVERVTRNTKKGAVIGLLVGATIAVVMTVTTPSCNGGCIGPSREAWLLPLVGMFGGIGIGAGALIGSTRSTQRLVYERK
jgi:hypothetical protein